MSTAILDKTGSLTHRSEVVEIRAVDGFSDDELLRLAARLEQASGYILAAALIKAARAKGLSLSPPEAAREVPGTRLDGRLKVIKWLCGAAAMCVPDPLASTCILSGRIPGGAAHCCGSSFRNVAGVIALEHPFREDAPTLLAELRASAISRIVFASEDRTEITNVVWSQPGD